MALKNISILDYSSGNLHSITNCFASLGVSCRVISTPDQVLKSDGLVLPGVGAFGDAMANLRSNGLDLAIKDFHTTGRPVLGICLGLQILFDDSNEFGQTEGLGLLSGKVRSFSNIGQKVRVPNVGWYNLIHNPESKATGEAFKTISEKEFFYFVHSFYVEPSSREVILSESVYEGFQFCSSASKDNITAFQFHPEKSARPGIQLIRNWLQN